MNTEGDSAVGLAVLPAYFIPSARLASRRMPMMERIAPSM
jgi:hypothetical protein